MARGTRRYSKRKRNPDEGGGLAGDLPDVGEVLELAIPGFAAFGASTLATRATTVFVAGKAPSMAKHAGVLTAAGVVALAWFFTRKSKFLHQYQTPIVVGTIIAGLKSVLQLYLPSLGWVVSDPTPELAAGSDAAALATTPQVALPQGFKPVQDDPNLYTFDDRFDGSQQAQQSEGAGGAVQSAEDQLLADLEADQQKNGLGIFGN